MSSDFQKLLTGILQHQATGTIPIPSQKPSFAPRGEPLRIPRNSTGPIIPIEDGDNVIYQDPYAEGTALEEILEEIVVKDRPKKTRTVRGAADGIEALKQLIGGVESNDNYYAVAGGDEAPFKNPTINQLQQWQRNKNKKGTRAFGKYQLMPDTLDTIKNLMGLSGDEKLTPKMQEKVALTLLKHRGLKKYLKGKLTPDEFLLELSKEWAALPKDSSGISFYDKVGNNKALVGYEDVIRALQNI